VKANLRWKPQGILGDENSKHRPPPESSSEVRGPYLSWYIMRGWALATSLQSHYVGRCASAHHGSVLRRKLMLNLEYFNKETLPWTMSSISWYLHR